MRAKHFVFNQQQNLGRTLGASKMHLSSHPLSPGGLGGCSFYGGGSIVVNLFFN